MFCAECGKTIPDDARFCQACGRPVDVDTASSPPTPVPPLPIVPPPSSVPPPPPVPPAPIYAGYPPPPPASLGYGPPPVPPRRRHGGLIVGLVTALIILAAGAGVGLYFGLKGEGTPTAAVTTISPTLAVVTTTAPPTTTTTLAPTSTTSEATTTTSEATTTTTEVTTTTEDPTLVLAARATEWDKLLESIPTSSEDLTAKIAAYLTPKDQAQARAAAYVKDWKTPPASDDVVVSDTFQSIAKTTLSADGSSAGVVNLSNIKSRDGLTTRELEAMSWKFADGQWMRYVSYDPLPPTDGSLVQIGSSIKAGDFLWSPDLIQEVKHVAVKGGPTTAGMFMMVEFYVGNQGKSPLAAASFQVTAVDGAGKEYAISKNGDKWFTNDVQDRKTKIAAGDKTWLWYSFEIPEGSDLQSFQFRVALPTA